MRVKLCAPCPYFPRDPGGDSQRQPGRVHVQAPPNLRIGLPFLFIAPAYLRTIEARCDPPSLVANQEESIARQMSAIANRTGCKRSRWLRQHNALGTSSCFARGERGSVRRIASIGSGCVASAIADGYSDSRRPETVVATIIRRLRTILQL